MEGHEVDDPVGNDGRSPFERNLALVEREPIEARSMLRGESLELVERSFLVEHRRIAFEREGGVEDPRAPARGFLRFDREAVFIDRVLGGLVRDFPALRIVLEHITTAEAAQFVADAPATVAATITPQHLHLNRNALFAGGLRPHAYCLPVVKREKHRLAVRAAAVSGSPKYFLGTDSAPHAVDAKEASCGCAGIFNAPFALESYAVVFDEEGALDKFEEFASEHGPRFYGLPLNEGEVTLERRTAVVPDRVVDLVPFHSGGTLGWQMSRSLP